MSSGMFSFSGLRNLGGLLGPLYREESRCSLSGFSEDQSSPSGQLAIRILPIEGNERPTPFDLMMDELEENFLAVRGSSCVAVRTVIVSLYLDKRLLLDQTLARHGYRILDETII